MSKTLSLNDRPAEFLSNVPVIETDDDLDVVLTWIGFRPSREH